MHLNLPPKRHRQNWPWSPTLKWDVTPLKPDQQPILTRFFFRFLRPRPPHLAVSLFFNRGKLSFSLANSRVSALGLTQTSALIHQTSRLLARLLGLAGKHKRGQLVKLYLVSHLRRYCLLLAPSRLFLRVYAVGSDFKFLWKFLNTPLNEVFLNPSTQTPIIDFKLPLRLKTPERSAAWLLNQVPFFVWARDNPELSDFETLRPALTRLISRTPSPHFKGRFKT